MTRSLRRFADAVTELLVPRTKANAACKPCYVAGTCAGGYQRICCYVGSGCYLSCGCS